LNFVELRTIERIACSIESILGANFVPSYNAFRSCPRVLSVLIGPGADSDSIPDRVPCHACIRSFQLRGFSATSNLKSRANNLDREKCAGKDLKSCAVLDPIP